MSRERNHTVTTEENTKMNDQETQHYTDRYILRRFAWMVEKRKTFQSDCMKSETLFYVKITKMMYSAAPLGGTPIYKLYGYVSHFRVWFLSCFSLK